MTARFLADHEIVTLSTELRRVPWLVANLHLAHTRQTRLTTTPASNGRRDTGSASLIPFDERAADAATRLHTVLTTWCRRVAEHRHTTIDTWTRTSDLARWLGRYRFTLAGMADAPTAYADIRAAVDHASRIVSPPPPPEPAPDPARIAQARREELNATGIETLARTLGEEYRHLTRRRVHMLAENGHVSPVRHACGGTIPVFEVGQVLDAHLRVPIRRIRMA